MGEDAEWLENCGGSRQPDGLTEPLAVQLWKAEETFKFNFKVKTVGSPPTPVNLGLPPKLA